ncbi:MAG TPA: ABC transporter permease [Euzebyales bacterium]|nr:ABC transporter permease [Euzebyales bacterium]
MTSAPTASPVSGRLHRWLPYLLLAPGILWLVIFFFVPMLTLFQTSLQEGSLQQGYVLTWRFANYTDALSAFGSQYLRSFFYAGVATVGALALGYPLAYFIAFRAGRWRNVFLLLVIMPLLVSFLVRTLAWKIILADQGPVIEAFKLIGLLPDNGRLLATAWAVVAGLMYNYLPFMILPLYASLEKIDPRLVEAAHDLYASPFVAFRKITLPLSLPGVVAGTLLMFIPAAGDFVHARFLGTPSHYMIGNVIESRFLVVLDYPTAAALSFVLMATILALVLIYLNRVEVEEVL